MTDPKPYQWDFAGSCAPERALFGHYQTFSLGIFQWVPRASGKGLKRGKVVRRVKGFTDKPEEARARARLIVADLNLMEPRLR